MSSIGTRQLHDTRSMEGRLELELRQLWGLGYQALKFIMIDIVLNHPEYAHLAAYYMEHSNPVGVVTEFQRPLAKLYGLTSWHYDDEKDYKRAEYWKNAFTPLFRSSILRNNTTAPRFSSFRPSSITNSLTTSSRTQRIFGR